MDKEIKKYKLNEVLEILKKYKITSSIYFLRRLIREKKLVGKKIGRTFIVTEENLHTFIKSKQPDYYKQLKNTIDEIALELEQKKGMLLSELNNSGDSIKNIELEKEIVIYQNLIQSIYEKTDGFI